MVVKKMIIQKILREYIFALSILTIATGIILVSMGVIEIWFSSSNLNLGMFIEIIHTIGGYIAYVFVAGIIVLGIGTWYLYDFLRKRKHFLKEIGTNKRSEFIKKHIEMGELAKTLPSKYKKMFEEKNNTLRGK